MAGLDPAIHVFAQNPRIALRSSGDGIAV